MYEILNSFKQRPIPNISTKTHQFCKTPKSRFQNMKCMNVRGLEAYQVKKNLKKLEESLRNQDWSEIWVF